MTRGRKPEYVSDSMLQDLRSTIEEPLKRQIDQLRRTVLGLARDPELVYEALKKDMGESDPWVWERQAVKTIIERVTRGPLAEMLPQEIYRHMPGVALIGPARVPCPLCGGGRSALSYQEDEIDTIGTYSVLGLERHLEGYGDRMPQCPVMAAARDLARDAWQRKQRSEVHSEKIDSV